MNTFYFVLLNKSIIPLVFLAAIISVPAISSQSAHAGIGGFFGDGPSAPSPHTTIMPTHGTFGFGDAPILYWGEPFMIILDTDAWDLCPTSTVTSVTVGLGPFSDNVFDTEGGEFAGIEFEIFSIQQAYAGMSASQPMVDQGDGTWKANFPALIPLHGNAPLTYTWTCSDSFEDGSMEDGGIFMDPSGQVTDACTGEPIENARVTLFSDHDGDLDTEAPFGTYIPPINPLFTDVNGLYAWDVEPGPSEAFPIFYKVLVEADAGTGASQNYVSQTSGALPVPPPQTGIDFALVPESGCGIGGEIIPIDSTSLLLAGIQTSAMWILPIAFAGAGFAAFKLRKYWN